MLFASGFVLGSAVGSFAVYWWGLRWLRLRFGECSVIIEDGETLGGSDDG